MFSRRIFLISVVLVVGLTSTVSADWTGKVSSDWYDPAKAKSAATGTIRRTGAGACPPRERMP